MFMKNLLLGVTFIFSVFLYAGGKANECKKVFIQSRLDTLKLAIHHLSPQKIIHKQPILFIHGSSFPTELAFGFRMEGYSWMDDLADYGYDVYGLDFLGYGSSDRYPEMSRPPGDNKPVGRAHEVYLDIDKAVNYLITMSGSNQVNIIAHSWGGSVAALYAQKFPDKVNKLVLFSTITANESTSDITDKVNVAYNCLTPERRIESMKNLTPTDSEYRLEEDILLRGGKSGLNQPYLIKSIILMRSVFPPDL